MKRKPVKRSFSALAPRRDQMHLKPLPMGRRKATFHPLQHLFLKPVPAALW